MGVSGIVEGIIVSMTDGVEDGDGLDKNAGLTVVMRIDIGTAVAGEGSWRACRQAKRQYYQGKR